MNTLYDNTFKFRVGDSDEKGGCTFIGGSWVDKTTDDLFKNKKIVIKKKDLACNKVSYVPDR